MTYRPRNRIWVPATLAAPVIGLSDMKRHLRVDHDAEDGLIEDLTRAAVLAVERWTQRLLLRRSSVLTLPDLPSGDEPVELPGGEVASVTSVIADAVAVTGTTVAGNSPALLLPATTWPAVTGTGFPVAVTYVAGFAAVPADLVAAIKLIAADLYEYRGQTGAQAVSASAINAEWLMAPHRIRPL